MRNGDLSRFSKCVGAAALVGIAGIGVGAEPSRSYTTYADVVDVEPLVERQIVNRRHRVCASEPYRRGREVRHRDYRDARYDDRPYYSERRHGAGAAIVGGILGGLLGHQFGGGSGKEILTIGGALAGAAMADRAAHGHSRREHRYERCWMETSPESIESVQGYRVTYTYQGRTFSRVMDSDPGNRLRMNVQVMDID